MIINIDETRRDVNATFQSAVNVVLDVEKYSEFIGICKSVLPSSAPNPSAASGKFTAKVVAGLGFVTYEYMCSVAHEFSDERESCIVSVSLLDKGALINEIDLKWEIVSKQRTGCVSVGGDSYAGGSVYLGSVRAYGVIKTKDVMAANFFKPAINGYISSIVQSFCNRIEFFDGDSSAL